MQRRRRGNVANVVSGEQRARRMGRREGNGELGSGGTGRRLVAVRGQSEGVRVRYIVCSRGSRGGHFGLLDVQFSVVVVVLFLVRFDLAFSAIIFIVA